MTIQSKTLGLNECVNYKQKSLKLDINYFVGWATSRAHALSHISYCEYKLYKFWIILQMN